MKEGLDLNSSYKIKLKDGSPQTEGIRSISVGKIHLRRYPVVQTLMRPFIIIEGEVVA